VKKLDYFYNNLLLVSWIYVGDCLELYTTLREMCREPAKLVIDVRIISTEHDSCLDQNVD